MDSDSVLISRIQTGDREALATLYERYLPSVWRYVYSRLRGDEAVIRDVVSETFLAMIQNIGRLDAAPANVAKWLTGVARHKLADHCRRLGPQKQLDEDGADTPDHGSDPVAAMDASETRRVVGEVMAGMEDAQRIVLEWKYIEGLTVREMAGRLNCTEKAVEAILYRARGAFKAQYKRMNQ